MFWFIYSISWTVIMIAGFLVISETNPLSLLPKSKKKRVELEAAKERQLEETKLLADPDYREAMAEVELELGYPSLEEVLRSNSTKADQEKFDKRVKRAQALVNVMIEKAIGRSKYGCWDVTHTLFAKQTENHSWKETESYLYWLEIAEAVRYLLKERYPELIVEIYSKSDTGFVHPENRVESVELYIAWAFHGQKEPTTLEVLTGDHKWLDNPFGLEYAKRQDVETR